MTGVGANAILHAVHTETRGVTLAGYPCRVSMAGLVGARFSLAAPGFGTAWQSEFPAAERSLPFPARSLRFAQYPFHNPCYPRNPLIRRPTRLANKCASAHVAPHGIFLPSCQGDTQQAIHRLAVSRGVLSPDWRAWIRRQPRQRAPRTSWWCQEQTSVEQGEMLHRPEPWRGLKADPRPEQGGFRIAEYESREGRSASAGASEQTDARRALSHCPWATRHSREQHVK
jgi:hypothetical protein